MTYSKIFNAKVQKYNKIFSSKELVQENIFHENTGLMIISGQKKDFGFIKYCSKQLQGAFGGDLIGQSLMTCFPRLMRPSYEKKLQDCLNSTTSLNRTHLNQVCVDKDGFLFRSSLYFNISPCLAKGFNFYLFSRKCKANKDYILIRNDGSVEDFSRNVAEKLGLIGGKLKINQICPELEIVNNALNFYEDYFCVAKNHENNSEIKPSEKETKAQEIFNDYTSEGKRLTFFSFGKQDEGFVYHCKIDKIGIPIGKLLILEEIKFSNRDGDSGPSPERFKVTESQFITEEEKEGEWIDFDLLERDIKKEQNNELPKQTEGIFLSTERNLIMSSPRQAPRMPSKNQMRSTEVEVIEIKEKQSSVASKSRVDSQGKISKSFEIAVTTKFYSNLYKLLLVLVYVILVGLLVSMIVLTQTLNADLGLLQGRKELITSLEMENVLVTNAQRNMRILMGFASGLQDENDYDPLFKTAALLNNLSTDVLQMAEYNRIFLKNIELLDPQNRERIFTKDVKIYESGSDQSFILFTIIEAVQKMLEMESKAVGIAKIDVKNALEIFKIIMRNSLNDFLVTNQAKIAAILESSHVNKGKAFKHIDKNWFATLACMGGLAVLYVGIIVKQYKREKRNLIAFTKLNPQRVKHIEAKITAFMNIIENEEELKPIQNLNNNDSENHNNVVKGGINSWKAEDRGIFLKYFFYSVYFLIMILAVIGFVSLSCVQAKASINNLNLGLFQLMFAAKSMSRINLALTIPIELFANSGGTLIENYYPSVELDKMVQELDAIEKGFLSNFDSSDNVDRINNILYKNACIALQNNAQQIASCQQLKKGLGSGYSSGFVQFIDYLRSLLQEVASRYESSDKSTASLTSLQKEYINGEMDEFLVMTPINKILVEKLDWEFENKIDQSRVQSTLLNCLLYVFLIGVCFALYLGVLKKIGENDNEFKKVLRVFPSNLIFSNFILKSYLLNTSAGALSSVINAI